MDQIMILPKVDVEDTTLATLLNYLGSGQLQVPRFQREFVWPLTKTRALLDSMFKEFPIGTFFLWKAPAGTPHLIKELKEINIPDPQLGNPVWYILDGQQRLASLYCVIKGISIGWRNYGRICIDLETATRFSASQDEDFSEDIFVYKTSDNNRYVAVKDLVSDRHLMIFKDIPDSLKNAFIKAANILNNYPFSVVWIQEQLLGNAIEIFTRINDAGQRLSRYDLVCANVWREDFDFRIKVENINKTYIAKGFGKIDETVFTQTFSLIIHDKCTTAAELSLKTDPILNTWSAVIKAIDLAVDYCVNTFGVKRIDFLPYRGLLVLLSYFFYHREKAPSADDRKMLWQYFWRTTLSERYSATSPTKMAEDAEKIKAFINGKKVSFDYSSKVNTNSVLRAKMSSTTSIVRNATLCMLALKTPLNLKDNSKVNLGDEFFSNLKQVERHHIFPVGFLRTKGVDQAQVHLLPNFCFIPSNLNKEIGSQAPYKYIPTLQKNNPKLLQALDTHIIPRDDNLSLLMDENGFYPFLAARAELLASELNKLVDEIPPDLQPLAPMLPFAAEVDVMEIRIRDFINQRLRGVMGSIYPKIAIPPDVLDAANREIEIFLSTNPYENRSQFSDGRRFLDYCDVPHYEKIILKNWDHFGGYFGRKDEFQRHMSAFSTLCNSVKNSRAPTKVEEKNGEAALIWLGQVLDAYDQEIIELEKEDGDELDFAQDIQVMEGLE